MIVRTTEETGQLVKWASKEAVVSFDTETNGFFDHANRIKTLQFGNREVQYIVDFDSISQSDKLEINRAILTNPNILKIGQNLMFDIKFLWLEGLDLINMHDLMLGELLLYAGRKVPRSYFALAAISSRYLGIKMSKEMQSVIADDELRWSEEGIQYMYNDVKHLTDVHELQFKTLKKLGMKNVMNLENRALASLAEIEYHGMKIDLEQFSDISDILTEQKTNQLKVINTLAKPMMKELGIEEINWNSWQQKLKLLRLIIPDLEDTNARTLGKHKQDHDIFKELIKYNKINKLLTGFVNGLPRFINPVTNRLHPNIWPGVSTGRISSSKPNLLNIPSRGEIGKLMRHAFIAEDGYDIVGGDYSGAELRIMAEFSRDPLWIKAFKEDKDLHTELAMLTFNIPEDKVRSYTSFKPDMTYRECQKVINFGLSYGMSAHKLSDFLEISVQEAQNIIDDFFANVPVLKAFLEGLKKNGVARGYVRSGKPFSRYRFFDVREDISFKKRSSIEREACNHPIQATCADIIKLALYNIRKEIKLKDYPVKLIASVYDEILTECREDFSLEWKPIMENLMLDAWTSVLKVVPIRCDVMVGKSWGDVH